MNALFDISTNIVFLILQIHTIFLLKIDLCSLSGYPIPGIFVMAIYFHYYLCRQVGMRVSI